MASKKTTKKTETKQTETKQTETKQNETSNETLLNLPVTVTPSGLNLLVQQINSVTGGNVTIAQQGKSWLKLVNYTKEQHEQAISNPQIKANVKALLSWINGKDGSIAAWVYRGSYSNDYLASFGVHVDDETRIVSIVDPALLLGPKPKKAAKPKATAAGAQESIAQLTEITAALGQNAIKVNSDLADLKSLLQTFMVKVGA